jgi:hypothetical protein
MDVPTLLGVGELESEDQDGSKVKKFLSQETKRDSVLTRMVSTERLAKTCRMHNMKLTHLPFFYERRARKAAGGTQRAAHGPLLLEFLSGY